MDRRSLLLSTSFSMMLFQGTLLAESCANLKNAVNPAANAVASEVSSGAFMPPRTVQPMRDLPAFCRVTATLRPTSDSDIGVEVWLPLQNWNGKYMAVGSGGW